MSLPADAGYSAAATEGHSYFRQLFAVDPTSGEIIAELKMDPSTALEVSDGVIRRSGTLVLPNEDGLYTPATGGLIDFGIAYLLRFGILAGDTRLVCDQPWLFPDFDEIEIGARTVSIPVSDGMRVVAAESKLASPITFLDGTALEAMFRAALVACGVADEDANFGMDAGGAHVVGDHGYEAGTQWSTILSQWQSDYAMDLWCAPPNVYTLRAIPDPATIEPVAVWQRGAQVRMAGIKVRRETLAKNHAIVSGIDQYGQPFTVEAFDLNPDSPIMWGKPGVGDLQDYYQSDGITTPEQAEAVARSRLITRRVRKTFVVSVPHDASLDRRDVVRIIEPTTQTDSLAMLDSFPVPVAPGVHQVSVIEARSLV